MAVSRRLSEAPGVTRAAVLMGTSANMASTPDTRGDGPRDRHRGSGRSRGGRRGGEPGGGRRCSGRPGPLPRSGRRAGVDLEPAHAGGRHRAGEGREPRGDLRARRLRGPGGFQGPGRRDERLSLQRQRVDRGRDPAEEARLRAAPAGDGAGLRHRADRRRRRGLRERRPPRVHRGDRRVGNRPAGARLSRPRRRRRDIARHRRGRDATSPTRWAAYRPCARWTLWNPTRPPA